jgi:hypothetical protein
VLPDLGRHSAGDASGLSARAADEPDGALPAPTGGRKEYTDEAGRVVRVVEWFGYKFHLLVDIKHEVILAWQITAANVGDNEVLPALLAQAQANLPAGRIQTLAYDKACDDVETHRLLHRQHIAPLIQNRSLWKEEFERPLPGKLKADNLVHDEAGTVYCYDLVREPPVRHKMSYIGHEKVRGTLKYRCPACPPRRTGVARVPRGATPAGPTAGRSASNANWTYAASRPSRGPPSSLSGCTKAAQRWSGSTRG